MKFETELVDVTENEMCKVIASNDSLSKNVLKFNSLKIESLIGNVLYFSNLLKEIIPYVKEINLEMKAKVKLRLFCFNVLM